MFGLYFYLIGVVIAVKVITGITVIVTGIIILVTAIRGICEISYDWEDWSVMENLWDKLLKKLLIVFVALIIIFIATPSENTIKAIMFDKIIVENAQVIKENAQVLVDYTIQKIKELK